MPLGLFRATKNVFLSQDSRRDLTNIKIPKTAKMRAQGPRSRGLGPWVYPARELQAAAVLCPRCPVRSGSVRCSRCRGVTASRAIRNDRPCEVRGAELCCLIRLPRRLHHPALIAPPALANKPVLADVIITTSSQLRSQDSTQGEILPANTLRFFIQRQPGLCLWEAGTGHLPRALLSCGW